LENTGGFLLLNAVLTESDNIRITFFGLAPITDARILFKLTFQILPDATPGETILNLSVAPAGVTGPSGLINVNTSNGSINILPREVEFDSLTANGAANTTTTTELTLTFSQAIPGLAASNIAVTGATKGALTGAGPTYTLAISGIANEGDTVTVAISSPVGYSVTPASREVTVHKAAAAVSFTGLTANGAANTTTTTELTLTFSQAIPGLAASNITVTGATKGALTGAGPTYTLAISGIANEGDTVTVAISSPVGYSVTPASREVKVHKAAVTIGTNISIDTRIEISANMPIVPSNPSFDLSAKQVVSGYLFVAAYDIRGCMVNFSSQAFSLIAGENKTVEAFIPNIEGLTYKFFIWDDNYVPLTAITAVSEL
jgi:hypothetical protein